MPGPTGRFGSGDRLLRSSEFRVVGLEGRRAADGCFVVLVRSRREAVSLPKIRLGITVSRKVGGSVVRNRVKRHVREWFRRARGAMRPGIDLVVIGRRAAATAAVESMEQSLRKLTRAAGAELAS